MNTVSQRQNSNRHSHTTFLAVVAKINTQRSVEIRLLGKDGWMPVGNVTIPIHRRTPKVGGILEVKGVCAADGSSSLQPMYVAERHDVEQTDCVLSQLKFDKVDAMAL